MLYLPKIVISALLFTSSLAGPVERRLHRLSEHIQDGPSRRRLDHLIESIQPKTANAQPKRQSAPFVTTGVPATDGSPQPRLEIRTLASNADQFNMLLLGLQRMQAMDQHDLLSFYQIVGIHGRPEISWNDVHPTSGVQNNNASSNPGYCAHSSNLFLPWHRPYVALYEQLVVANALDVANQFPEGPNRDRYVAAARQLRLPYWDWAMKPPSGTNTIPDVLIDPKIKVTTPTGIKTIPNPLASYKFHPTEGLYWQVFLQWPDTKRWPTSTDANATTQNYELTTALNLNRAQYQQRLYNILTQYPNFMNFTNEPFINPNSSLASDSLEALHDSVHITTGGMNLGHMAVIEVSSFDPIFWLHHTMTDRIFALYQVLYPDSYVEPQQQYQSSYWYNQNQTLDVNTPLLPFYSDGSGNFWTSDSVRDTTVFGYTYPELLSGSQSDVMAQINSLYGPNTNGSSTQKKRTTTSEPREYLCNIQTPKNALDGSYVVHIFLGDFSADPKEWSHDPDLVGSYGVTAMRQPNNQPEVIISGTIPLTVALQKDVNAGKLADMSDGSVSAYLTQNLHWRVQKVDGTVVDPATIPGFTISVVSTGVEAAANDDEFPKWVGDTITHNEVTNGRPGGSG